jgi:hypothetical protein
MMFLVLCVDGRGRYLNNQIIYWEEFRWCVKTMARLYNLDGGIHDMDVWYSRVNARMHWVDLAMTIGRLVLFIGKV